MAQSKSRNNQASNLETPLVRLNKFISDSGICSRRKADELIDNGDVRVNGKTITEHGLRVDPFSDQIFVKNKRIMNHAKNKVYYMFNKPIQVLTSMGDPQGRITVADFFQKEKQRIFPVGRLDWDSEGLLLMTNDGEFANLVNHPKEEIPKTYLVKVDGQPTEAQLEKLKRGVTIPEGGKVKALFIEKVKKGSDQYDWLRVVIGEGKNRQIRKMFQKIGYDVIKLKRTAIGNLPLGNLKKGEYTSMTAAQLMKIFESKDYEKIEKIRSEKKKSGRRKMVRKAATKKRAKDNADKKRKKSPLAKKSKPKSATFSKKKIKRSR